MGTNKCSFVAMMPLVIIQTYNYDIFTTNFSSILSGDNVVHHR